MIREIYFRNPDDTHYNPNLIEVSEELEVLLGKIRMIIFTNKGEVLGEPYFGLSLDDQLFSFNVSYQEIKRQFEAQLAKYCPESAKYNVSIDVEEGLSAFSKTIFLNIKINRLKYLSISIS